MTVLTNHTIGIAHRSGYGRCGTVSVWNSALHDAGRVVLFPQWKMEKNDITHEDYEWYRITTEDIQNFAVQSLGRHLTENELERAFKTFPHAWNATDLIRDTVEVGLQT